MSQSSFCENGKNELNQSIIDWFSSPLGARIAAVERDAIGGMLADVFGYHLLQIGEFGGVPDHLDRCPIRRRLLVSENPATEGVETVTGEACRLPVAADSMDAAVLVHALDFSPDPHQVLLEVERVLIAEGRMIVVGFNPYSLWGVWRLAARWRGGVPWCGHFLSYPRLNDWLTLTGFAVERMDVMEFRPPMRSQRLESIERIGRQVWPMLAGIYVVRAVKRVSRVTPLKQQWPRLRVLGPRVIEPAAREPLAKS
ncbi:MAG: methyltransferase domain-containing protein [Gammaproteobacteria bacterium]|nr:methyltransferase domain-containing protein [Gammaproteobacteria bacterium]MCB1925780.1 methyltransferase domain-containing protein [Gammaproteobacteria bacterium]